MPYFVSDKQEDCSGWATVKQETNGSYTTITCHDNKQDAIDQMVAVSISEDMEPGGEVNSRSKMSKKIERRTFTVQDVEARQTEDGTMRLRGYAAVFNDASVPLPFKETIAPGAFRKTLSETPDVRLLINHEGLPLARTKNGTLTLTEDERGLFMDAVIADTNEGRDLYKLVERGDVDQMSFAFRVIRQKWNDDRSVRTLTEVSLADGDVSVVTYPAYPTTSVEAREALRNAIEAIKEGREVTGESLVVLNTIFEDLSEGHDYIMKAVEMMAMLTGGEPEEEIEVEEPELELESADSNATAGRSISLRLAKAIINNTK
jgi:HK97 family phage prohead protease